MADVYNIINSNYPHLFGINRGLQGVHVVKLDEAKNKPPPHLVQPNDVTVDDPPESRKRSF